MNTSGSDRWNWWVCGYDVNIVSFGYRMKLVAPQYSVFPLKCTLCPISVNIFIIVICSCACWLMWSAMFSYSLLSIGYVVCGVCVMVCVGVM